jgi:uncharacterized protein (TIGR02679 family)
MPAALAPLWRELHRRFSTGQAVRRVRVGPLDAAARDAIADLFGTARLPQAYATIRVADLDVILGEVVGSTTYDVVEQLVGPIDDRAGVRRAAAAERNRLWEWLSGHEVVRAQPVLDGWAAAMQWGGLIGGSVERTRAELERALRVVRELPSAGTPLPVFADAVLGDPHSLDDGTRVQSMVVRALATIYGVEMPGPTAVEQLWRVAVTLLERFPRWARGYRGDDGVRQLVSDAVAVLVAFGLVRTTTSGLVIPLPAAARYRVGDIKAPDPSEES